MVRRLITLSIALLITACATTPDGDRPPGEHGCEAFFIYELCVSDLDVNGTVDYMYFDDSRDIFMYHEPMKAALDGVLPFHRCAIPMNEMTRDYASQLLYGDDLGIAERLRIKGKLIVQYRAAQAAVDACYMDGAETREVYDSDKDPFLIDEEWDEGAL